MSNGGSMKIMHGKAFTPGIKHSTERTAVAVNYDLKNKQNNSNLKEYMEKGLLGGIGGTKTEPSPLGEN